MDNEIESIVLEYMSHHRSGQYDYEATVKQIAEHLTKTTKRHYSLGRVRDILIGMGI